MTPAQLETRLKALLSGLVGSYKEASFDRGAAISVGEPPSTYRCTSGLEVRIEAATEMNAEHLHQLTVLGEDIPVRVIAHDRESVSKAATAVRRITSALPTADSPRFIPANETHEILAQYVLRVRSK